MFLCSLLFLVVCMLRKEPLSSAYNWKSFWNAFVRGSANTRTHLKGTRCREERQSPSNSHSSLQWRSRWGQQQRQATPQKTVELVKVCILFTLFQVSAFMHLLFLLPDISLNIAALVLVKSIGKSVCTFNNNESNQLPRKEKR